MLITVKNSGVWISWPPQRRNFSKRKHYSFMGLQQFQTHSSKILLKIKKDILLGMRKVESNYAS